MITIDEMLAIIAIGDGVFIKVAPEDWVRRFSKPITREKLIEQYPAKYRNDLVGFVVVGEYSYRPCFATMQSEWDAELSGYIARKAEWCRENGSN